MNKKILQDLIIMNVTGFSKDQLFLNKTVPEKYKKEILEKISRLEYGEPIEYIINKAEFYGLDFYVDSRVLIPRDDTEVMVYKVLREIDHPLTPSSTRRGDSIVLIDVWTGSGCVPIGILKNTEKVSKCFFVDISKDALDVASINIDKHWLGDRVELVEWNLLEKLPSLLSTYTHKGIISLPLAGERDRNIIITANLPYIKDADHENMDNETIKFEPGLALYWWKKTGFELYEKLIRQCTNLIPLLVEEGLGVVLFIEIGFDQKKIAEDFLNNLGLKFELLKDNNWIERCIKIIIN